MANKPQFLEKFDLNHFQISGQVQRVWSLGQDVVLRLLAAGPFQALAEGPGCRYTLLIPHGCVQGAPVTLMKGDWITAGGYLKDMPYVESGRQFAEKTRKGERLLADIPALADVVSERMATYCVVQALDFHLPAGEALPPVNAVTVEGLISTIWKREEQYYLRLAVYDRFTRTTDKTGKHGRPWRQAHYLSVHLVDGKVGGRPVNLQEKDRVRVIGHLNERHYSESLGLFLLRTRQIGLLSEAPDADQLREIRAPRVSTYLMADSLVQFTR
jgi:hypothetical protein